MGILQKIFSIKKDNNHKIFCILGLTIKIKNRLEEEKNIKLFSFWEAENFVVCNSLLEAFIKQTDPNCFYQACCKYFGNEEFEKFLPNEILIYIANLIECNYEKKAIELLYKYIDLYKTQNIWKYPIIANFAEMHNIEDNDIKKSSFVYKKLKEDENIGKFESLIKDKTIAIVGNSPSELGMGNGYKIDAHDIVIRMNNYQTKGYENDYGNKTDIWIRGFGGNDLKDYTKVNNYLYSGITGDFVHIPFSWKFQLDILYRDLTNNISTGYISPISYRNLRKDYKDNPTTGLSVIYTVLKFCEYKNIDFYGFNFLQENIDKYATHYFNDRSYNKTKKRSKMHSLDKEAMFLKGLIGELK